MTSKAFLEPSWRFDNQTAAGLLASPFSERLPTSSSAKQGSSGLLPRVSSQRRVVIVKIKGIQQRDCTGFSPVSLFTRQHPPKGQDTSVTVFRLQR